MKKVLLWDFDGTLVYTNKSFFETLAEMLADRGCAVSSEEIDEFLCHTSTWFSPEKSYADRTGELWWEDYFRSLGAFLRRYGINDAGVFCREFRDGVMNYRYTLYSDARDILAYSCEKGYANCILSNNFPELPYPIEKLGLAKYFDGYFLSSCIGYEKPRQELYRHVIGAVSPYEVCFMIGDNPTADIEAGKKVGLKTILVHSGQRNEFTDFCCAELTEIMEII